MDLFDRVLLIASALRSRGALGLLAGTLSMAASGALASFRRPERMAGFHHPLLKFKLGHFPPSVVSRSTPPAAHRSGRQARVQNAVGGCGSSRRRLRREN